MVVKHLMIYTVKIECLPNAREFEMLKPQHLIREQKEHCYQLLVIRLFQSVYCSVSLYCALCKCSAFPLLGAPKILTFPALCYIDRDNVAYLRSDKAVGIFAFIFSMQKSTHGAMSC